MTRRHSRRGILAAGLLAVVLSGGALALAGLAAWSIVQPDGTILGTALLLVGFASASLLGLATTYGLGELVLEDGDRRGDEAVEILDEAMRGVDPTYFGAHWPDPGE